jgi:hypothetical protein
MVWLALLISQKSWTASFSHEICSFKVGKN